MKKWGWLIITGALLLNAINYFEGYAPSGTTSIQLSSNGPAGPSEVWSKDERECITRVVYNESRNQAELGQLAVAATLLNRSLSPKFSREDVCQLAKQRGQFAYVAIPSPKNATDRAALVKAAQVAEYVTSNYGALPEELRSYLYFNSHPPRKGASTIGDHNFYA